MNHALQTFCARIPVLFKASNAAVLFPDNAKLNACFIILLSLSESFFTAGSITGLGGILFIGEPFVCMNKSSALVISPLVSSSLIVVASDIPT